MKLLGHVERESVRRHLPISLVCLLLIACGNSDKHKPHELELGTTLRPDQFISVIETEYSERLSKINAGPLKIGKSKNGYASKWIKEVFDAYDWDAEFKRGNEINDEVCNFTKAMIFSKETKLSEFYWHHPNADKVPMKKIDKHIYQLTDHPRYYVNFGYEQHNLVLDGKPTNYDYPFFSLCNLGDSPDIKYYEYYKADGIKLVDLRKTRQSSLGPVRCFSENNQDLGKYGTIFLPDAPGSTIGFFWLKGELYLVSAKLNKGVYHNSNGLGAIKSVITSKVNYQLSPKTEYRPTISSFDKICHYVVPLK